MTEMLKIFLISMLFFQTINCFSFQNNTIDYLPIRASCTSRNDCSGSPCYNGFCYCSFFAPDFDATKGCTLNTDGWQLWTLIGIALGLFVFELCGLCVIAFGSKFQKRLTFTEIRDLDSEIIEERRQPYGVRENYKVGVCLSGGGIRSAAFALGVLGYLNQQNNDFLARLDYIASVSGGGYTATSLLSFFNEFKLDPRDVASNRKNVKEVYNQCRRKMEKGASYFLRDSFFLKIVDWIWLLITILISLITIPLLLVMVSVPFALYCESMFGNTVQYAVEVLKQEGLANSLVAFISEMNVYLLFLLPFIEVLVSIIIKMKYGTKTALFPTGRKEYTEAVAPRLQFELGDALLKKIFEPIIGVSAEDDVQSLSIPNFAEASWGHKILALIRDGYKPMSRSFLLAFTIGIYVILSSDPLVRSGILLLLAAAIALMILLSYVSSGSIFSSLGQLLFILIFVMGTGEILRVRLFGYFLFSEWNVNFATQKNLLFYTMAVCAGSVLIYSKMRDMMHHYYRSHLSNLFANPNVKLRDLANKKGPILLSCGTINNFKSHPESQYPFGPFVFSPYYVGGIECKYWQQFPEDWLLSMVTAISGAALGPSFGRAFEGVETQIGGFWLSTITAASWGRWIEFDPISITVPLFGRKIIVYKWLEKLFFTGAFVWYMFGFDYPRIWFGIPFMVFLMLNTQTLLEFSPLGQHCWLLFQSARNYRVPQCAYVSDGGHFENLGLLELLAREVDLIICSDNGEDPNHEHAELKRSLEAAMQLGVISAVQFYNKEGQRIVEDWTLVMTRHNFTDEIFAIRVKFNAHAYETWGLILYLHAPKETSQISYNKMLPPCCGTFPNHVTGNQCFCISSLFRAYRDLGEWVAKRAWPTFTDIIKQHNNGRFKSFLEPLAKPRESLQDLLALFKFSLISQLRMEEARNRTERRNINSGKQEIEQEEEEEEENQRELEPLVERKKN